ncbi:MULTISPECIES: arginine--tRNA ligase [unclassified Guyparkeria]|uniref:arginine--tRNA ligase n=1 Tax=unclassified Guyparkeria TaxID=2626246 RepID=UPI0007339A8E|nr:MULTISPECIES: arginine--tRNA ligase [unclassified Guyparkeria]KTG18013.1 arginine--tRNA ligase [Guyparkeria sp. XI15]OAE89723.1 arginine--tRNA ligase [Guyparkeria sp. WRN-7]
MEQRLQAICQQFVDNGDLPAEAAVRPVLTVPKDSAHGDFASNLAMQLAKPMKQPPRAIAERIVEAFADQQGVERIEIAGPGFMNFFVEAGAAFALIDRILEEGERFGRSTAAAGERVQVEFVSANPTGPLHVGHGRGAAYGSVVANLLEAVGAEVEREYYVNDAGRQMHILAVSVWLRYLEARGEHIEFPSNGYRSEGYILDIARALAEEHGDRLVAESAKVFADLPEDAPNGDKERHIDALIERMRELLGETDYQIVFRAALDAILSDIREDLAEFGVSYDNWYSEQSLADRGLVERAIERLEAEGLLYERDGALWFRSTDFGDDKDRVVRRDNGQTTYFASDIAYHLDKFDRGFDEVIDIWGADHHGYVPRVKAAMTALGKPADRLTVSLVQFAILYRGGERVPMSTRSGSFVTLRELREEVGNDAARFFYVMRAANQHLDFDLDLAKSQSNENPLYYIQYAHARVASVLRQLPLRGFEHEPEAGRDAYARLTESHEQALFKRLSQYPALVERAAKAHEPHQLVHYLRDLAQDFHSYYNAHAFLLGDDAPLRNARLNLVVATRQVLANGLTLLGVNAPDEM